MNNIIYSLDCCLDNYISHVNETSQPILSDLFFTFIFSHILSKMTSMWTGDNEY